MNPLTPKLIYESLYAFVYTSLIKYGLSKDLSSRKANIYTVKHTWYYFSSIDKEATTYRYMLEHKINKSKHLLHIQITDLLESTDKESLCK